ncbi:fucose permease [Algoriphagus boseongensis]|uniref:Fucose permease n=1 Tax=Algoriphagus boseongensis TaxID=1442587 RepID=A0A4R6T563_9BACT|nr:MFS transporter [Algoriphagus boseongensis]TDQ16625.1 fucose permease [Algoriphagus boseongensis]
MKKKVLLLIIYLAFISLGLPDSLLGAAWPEMYPELKVPIAYAGIISMIVAAGTVISSLFSTKLIERFGVAVVTTVSVLFTALAIIGFAYSNNIIYLFLLAIPLGLGSGCVDAALNNYVALHYKASHMNWLHCFWGVGAAIGPVIMSSYFARGESWSSGYLTVGWIQLGLVAILLFSIPLWVKRNPSSSNSDGPSKKSSYREILKIPGIRQALIVFFCYCTIEATFGLWGASYLVLIREFKPQDAAKLVSFYYGGITIGRFLSGFLTTRFTNQQLVYGGQGVLILGLITLSLPFQITLLPAFLLIGLGCAPIFPSLLHETPRNFGEKNSQAIMGLQMASAYVGITIMPLIFGELAVYLTYSSLFWFLGIILMVKILLTVDLNRVVKKNRIPTSN